MAKRLTFFESLFLNKELKDRKLSDTPKSEEEFISTVNETFESTEFIKDEVESTTNIDTESITPEVAQIEVLSDSPDTDIDTYKEDVVKDEEIAVMPTEDIEEDVEEDNDDDTNTTRGIILLEKNYDESLYEEDDDDDFDDLGHTRVFSSLSKTLNFKSNINFDEDTSDYDDDDFDFEDIDIDQDFESDINNLFNELGEVDTTDSNDDEDSNIKLYNILHSQELENELFNTLDEALEDELVNTNNEELNNKEIENFDLSSGVMHFDLDDQLDISDIEGTAVSNSTNFVSNSLDDNDEDDTKVFNYDEFKEETLQQDTDEADNNFPVLGSLKAVSEEIPNEKENDDDEINIPLL